MKTQIAKGLDARKIVAMVAVSATAATPALATNYSWTTGGQYDSANVSPSAPSVLLSGDTLSITDGGVFLASDGLTTDSGATVTWTGGDLGFSDGAAVSNSGVWNADSSTALALIDGGYGGTFTNASGGVLESSGTGELSIDASGSLSFVNSGGTITAASGASILFDSGSDAQVTFSDGSTYKGSGQIIIGGQGGTFSGTQTFAAGSNVNFSAGYFANSATAAPGVTLNGNSTWSGGQFYGGYWNLTSGSTLTVDTTPGGSTKFFTTTNFTNNGTIDWTTADPILLSSGSTVTNNGTFLMTAATSMSDGGYGGTFVNNGIFVNTGGGTVTVDPAGSLSFQNSSDGVITATKASDTVLFTSGSYNQLTFANNSIFNGSGTINIAGDGALFTGAQNIASTTDFIFSSGYFVANSSATLNGNVNWTGGEFYDGSWTLAKTYTMTVATTPGGNTKYFNATNFTNNGAIDWTTADDVYLASGTTLTNNGTFLMTAATTVADGSYGGTFVNNGTFVNTGGGTVNVNPAGSLSFQNNSAGVITATKATDSIIFNSGNYNQLNFATNSIFNGAGTINISGDGAVFTGAQNIASGTGFILSSGYFVPGTGGATLNGSASWTGGQFYGGAWTLAGGSTLNVATTPGGNTKYFTATTFANNGTINWATTDDVYLASGTTLNNTGTFLISAATTIADGGYGGTFVNIGNLTDTNGGAVTVAPAGSLTFQNNSGGTITATKAGDSITFASGSAAQATFADSSQFKGAGSIVISGQGATFTGNQVVAGGTDFELSAGDFETGATGATLNGISHWSGGTFYGGIWNVASGSTLDVATTPGGTNTKQFAATAFTNAGTINWATADNISVSSGTTLTNNGSFNISQDASFVDGGYGGTLVNNGVLTKTGGTGTTSVAATGSFTGLVNNGVTQVNSGTIALGDTFTNPGTLAGTGTFTAGTLTNNGHVSPGVYKGAPGTLALTGNYVQGTTGFFDVGATGSANSLFNVSGTASLAGTVDVNCVGSCTYTKGTELLILTSSGLSGNFTSVTQSGFTGTNDFSLLQSGNNEYLVLDANVTAAVPEPSTYALILAGVGLLYGASRRRRLPAFA